MSSNEARRASRGWLQNAAGQDIWDYADSCHFSYARFQGNGSLTARIPGFKAAESWATAGLMIRASLEADSPQAAVLITPGHGVVFQGRTYQGGQNFQRVGKLSGCPVWLKLERQDQTIRAYESADGVAWSFIGWNAMELPMDCFVGLTASSHNPNSSCWAQFDSVVLAPQPIETRAGKGGGLLADYYDSASAPKAFSRIDPVINFEWGNQPLRGQFLTI